MESSLSRIGATASSCFRFFPAKAWALQIFAELAATTAGLYLYIIVLYLCPDSISMKQSEKIAVIGCGSTNEQGT